MNPAEPRRQTIERLLVDHADKRGWVDVSVRELEQLVGIEEHSLAHVLWDFKKRGLLTFREHKQGSATVLASLRITSSGRKALAASASEEEAQMIPAPVDEGMDMVRYHVEPEAGIFLHPVLAAPQGYGKHRWPLLIDLMAKAEVEGKIAQAAKLLEEAGEEDLAIKAMERGTLTILEAQMVDFIKEVNRPDLLS